MLGAGHVFRWKDGLLQGSAPVQEKLHDVLSRRIEEGMTHVILRMDQFPQEVPPNHVAHVNGSHMWDGLGHPQAHAVNHRKATSASFRHTCPML
eukprot:106121-Amphidinium_carterae.1